MFGSIVHRMIFLELVKVFLLSLLTLTGMFLLAGLVSTAIPFALGMAALLSARIDGAWLRAVRGWAGGL